MQLLAMLLLITAARIGVAHDIPGRVSLLIYVKPQADQVLVLTRVPLEALTEVQFPIRGPGYLDTSRIDAPMADATQIYFTQSVRLFADGDALPAGKILKTRIAAVGDKSFVDFNTALESLEKPLTASDDIYWKQATLDVLASYPIVSATSRIALETNLSRMAIQTHTVLHYLPPNNTERIYSYLGNPGRIELEPGWWHATYTFIELGFTHILEGIDHLLFLFCLVITTRSVRELVPSITAFTVAHSITLISSALQVIPTAAWFGPLIEALIALSVFYMACENALGVRTPKRWILVFVFGLIHGFGFSFILADRMQFAGEHLVSALLAFNVGVELGQLVVLIVAVPLVSWLLNVIAKIKTAGVAGARAGTILLSVLVAHTAWHWLIDRGAQLMQYSWQAPAFDAAFFVAVMRWAMLLLGSAAALWAMNELLGRFFTRKADQ